MDNNIPHIRQAFVITGFIVAICMTGCSDEGTMPSEVDHKTNDEEIQEPVPFDPTNELHWSILLQLAYNDESDDRLDDFFKRWQEWLLSTDEQTLSAAHKAVYDIFRVIFQSDTTSYIGKALADLEYHQGPYHLIQHSLSVGYIDEQVMDSLWTIWMSFKYLMANMDTIVDFRPALPDSLPTPVYFHPVLEDAIWFFIRTGYEEQRINFLNRRLTIRRRGWGGWQIVTLPEIHSVDMRCADILLNNELTRAIVSCRCYPYSGAEIHLEQTEGEWIIVDARGTWIM